MYCQHNVLGSLREVWTAYVMRCKEWCINAGTVFDWIQLAVTSVCTVPCCAQATYHQAYSAHFPLQQVVDLPICVSLEEVVPAHSLDFHLLFCLLSCLEPSYCLDRIIRITSFPVILSWLICPDVCSQLVCIVKSYQANLSCLRSHIWPTTMVSSARLYL